MSPTARRFPSDRRENKCEGKRISARWKRTRERAETKRDGLEGEGRAQAEGNGRIKGEDLRQWEKRGRSSRHRHEDEGEEKRKVEQLTRKLCFVEESLLVNVNVDLE